MSKTAKPAKPAKKTAKAPKAQGTAKTTKASPGRQRFWTIELLAAEAKKFTNKVEWRTQSNPSYQAARRLGVDLVNKIAAHMDQLARKEWTLPELLKDAKRFKTISAWKKNSSGAYMAAYRKRDCGWFKKCCAHFERTSLPKGHWTLKNCQKEASKYLTKFAWAKANQSSYVVSTRNGWLDECTKHMKKKKK